MARRVSAGRKGAEVGEQQAALGGPRVLHPRGAQQSQRPPTLGYGGRDVSGRLYAEYLSQQASEGGNKSAPDLPGRTDASQLFFNMEPFPGAAAPMSVRSVSSVPLESNRLSLLFRPAKLCSVSGCSS